MKILGIDPGYATLGWAIIEGSLKIIDYGFIETNQEMGIAERLFIIHNGINNIIKYYPVTSGPVQYQPEYHRYAQYL